MTQINEKIDRLNKRLSLEKQISNIKSGIDGYDWNKSIPDNEIRSILFVSYVDSYPLSKYDQHFIKSHTYLIDIEFEYGKKCDGCWNCCMKLNDIDYDKMIDMLFEEEKEEEKEEVDTRDTRDAEDTEDVK
jgi:hypothetical protein